MSFLDILFATKPEEPTTTKYDAQWWQDYNTYLKSQQWKNLRLAVLKRDNYLCQACLANRATQVHHLSYKIYNLTGHSAAFELVAICLICHTRIHPQMAQAQKPQRATRRK